MGPKTGKGDGNINLMNRLYYSLEITNSSSVA